MSILLNKKTSILVQGITGSEGLFHAWNSPSDPVIPWTRIEVFLFNSIDIMIPIQLLF